MNENKDNFFVEVFKFSLITLLIVLPFRIYIAKPFVVSGASMSPTFETGNYLIVDQISYHFEEPQRGDVIIFKYPKNETRYFIKRIIGLPNETIEVTNGNTIIKNEESPDGFILDEPFIQTPLTGNAKYTLGEDEYFVMGDNRPNSSDSRSWGLLNEKLIVGRAFIRLLPVSQIGILPGDFSFEN